MGWKDRSEVVEDLGTADWKGRSSIVDEPATPPGMLDEGLDDAPLSDMQKIREKIGKKYQVDPEWLKSRQIGMGYTDPDEQAEQMSDGDTISQGIVDAASASASSVLGEGLLGGLPSWIVKKISSKNEAMAMDELAEVVNQRKSGVATITEGILSGSPGAAASRAIKAPGMAGHLKRAALGVGEGIRAGVTESKEGEELEGAMRGAQIAGALETLPFVPAAGRQLRRLAPGTSEALKPINEATAGLAAGMPWQEASKGDISELLNKPFLRRKAASTNLLDKSESLVDSLNESKQILDKELGDIYRRGEQAFNSSSNGIIDQTMAADWQSGLAKVAKKVTDHEGFFSKAPKRMINNVAEIMNTGGPESITSLKGRMLASRRHMDEIIRGTNFQKLEKADRRIMQQMRDELDEVIKKDLTGGEIISKVDDLYHQYEETVGDFFKHVSKQGEEGVDLSKLYNDVRSNAARGRKFDDKYQGMFDYLADYSEGLGDTANQAGRNMISGIDEGRELAEMNALKGRLTTSAGGPTSRAVNAAMQLYGAQQTGGLSLLGAPVTNPSAYINTVDKMQNVPAAGAAAIEALKLGGGAPAIATKLLGKEEEAQAQEINQQVVSAVIEKIGKPLDEFSTQEKKAALELSMIVNKNPDMTQGKFNKLMSKLFPSIERRETIDQFLNNKGK